MPALEQMPQAKGEPDGLRERFNRDLKESTKYMEPIHQRMDRDYERYRNNRDTQDDEDPPTVSEIYTYVETITPIITNNRIRANVFSEYPEYTAHAKGLNSILDHTYDSDDWDYTSQELVRQALIQRSSIAYTGYDKEYKNGSGALCLRQCSMRWTYLDPSALCLEDSGYFFYAVPKRKSEVIKMYPKKKNEIKALSPSKDDAYSNNGSDGWFKTFIRSVKQRISFINQNQGMKRSTHDSVKPELEDDQRFANSIAFIEYWYRDDEDCWRKSCWADNLFLEDEENPFWHEQLPYEIYSPVKDIRSILGIPIEEQIGGIEKQLNDVLRYVIANARLHANPAKLFNTAVGNVKDVTKAYQESDGTWIPINNHDMIPLNAVFSYALPPNLDGNAVQMPERLSAIIDKITGVNDSFRGTQQATSGKEVQLQQEASYTRIKTMIDQFELFNKKLAEKIIVNAMQFYVTSRGFRIKGDYESYEQELKLSEMNGNGRPYDIKPVPKGLDGQGQPVMSRTEFFMYANPNEWTKLKPDEMEGMDDGEEEGTGEEVSGYGESRETEVDGSSDRGDKRKDESKEEKEVEKAFKILSMTVEIEAGSSLPQSRLARREEATQLYQMQAIDQESLLNIYDWPDREEIMKRMNEKAQQAAQMQSQASQAEAQAKMQAEQLRAQTDIQLKQMDIQGKMATQQQQNTGQVAEQSMENSGNSLASTLDQIRQQVPEAAQMSDQQLIQALGIAQ